MCYQNVAYNSNTEPPPSFLKLDGSVITWMFEKNLVVTVDILSFSLFQRSH